MRDSFANLPGQKLDVSARKLRAGLQAKDIEEKTFMDDVGYKNPDGTINEEALETELYALSSLIMEQQWEEYRKHLPEGGITLLEKKEGMTTGQVFSTSMIAYLDEQKQRFIDEARSRILSSNEPRTKEDLLLLRYFLGTKERSGVGVPSMNDLVVIMQRIGDVIPEVFLRDIGRTPTHEEVMIALRHPSLQRTLMEIMTNSRDISFPLLGRFEGKNMPDLNNLFGTYVQESFEMKQEEDGVYSIRVSERLTTLYLTAIRDYAEKVTAQGGEGVRALQCPVLYTGLFREMYEWFANQFERTLVQATS